MSAQDSFIEEEDDVCPLCIEEFDLSDKNFRPCPCGYQVCQFCFNNIKNNMNGLCPACRRPYDEKTIQWKVVTHEEVAEFRANIQKNQKKRVLDQRQKEVQKREAEKENRKNLIGVRVVQKNLVYITGLAPNVREDELLKTLRKPEFFGQYGTIQKISISNRKSPDGQHHSLGIYVTFETPDEAMRCIQAVHGSHNGDRVLKAQHGTTKYCSAWLKNEKCNNPGCMFLHEQGDEEDSYTRQDLSSMNSIHTQRPLQSSSSRSVSRQQPQHLPAAPPPPMPQPPVQQTQPMARSSSKDGVDTAADGSALPSSANWARMPQRSRRSSQAGSSATPVLGAAIPAVPALPTPEPVTPAKPAAVPASKKEAPAPAPAPAPVPQPAEAKQPSAIAALLNALQACYLPAVDSKADYGPPMFDVLGGEKRKALRDDEESRLDAEQREHSDAQSDVEAEAGGSHALGGEPDDRDLAEDQRFDQRLGGAQRGNDAVFSPTNSASGFSQSGVAGRSMTPQQGMPLRSAGGFADQFPPGITSQNSSAFNSQSHTRQSSRFNFGNDSSSTTSIKLATNPRTMGQQPGMMQGGAFQSQGSGQFFASSMPGPPPGLKSTGTPPNLFGQGFGAPGFGNIPKDSSNELLQSLIGRSRAGNGQSQDGKRESMISSLSAQYPPSSSSSTPAPASGLLASLYGNHPGAFQDMGSKQKKKGKKHRHANTSSSGGGGLVDLADPSILQSRMQHQTQSNAGTGQGLFGGGQSQEDDMPFEDAIAISSVEALISDDSPNEEPQAQQQQPPTRLPPGFEARVPTMPPPGLAQVPSLSRQSSEAQKAPFLPEEFPALGAPTKPAVPAVPRLATSKSLPARSSPMKVADKPAEAKPLGLEQSPAEKDGAASPPAASTPRAAVKSLRVMSSAVPSSPVVTLPAARAVSMVQRPDTPASENISDTASVVSTNVSISRPGSPVLGKSGVGARGPTKSQQRKQRREAVKLETKLIAETVKAEEEHAPVLGRKKKQKKEKPVKEKPEKAEKPEKPAKVEEKVEEKAPEKEEEKEPEVAEVKVVDKKPTAESTTYSVAHTLEVTDPSQPLEPEARTESPVAATAPEQPPIGPVSVFSEIKGSLWTQTMEKLQLFRQVSNTAPRGEQAQGAGSTAKAEHCKEAGCKCGEIQPDDITALRAGQAVRKQFHVDGSRMLITPNGDCVRGLTPAEEEDFLTLQSAIGETAENPGAFVAPRHQSGNGAFSLIKGRAVPNGRPNIFPATAQPQSQDPIGKLQREDALSYINQYVLPRLNLGVAGGPGSNKNAASSPRDTAAASLNSLAPYFYGPDAAAGVGIYSSSTEGSRPVHDFGHGAADLIKGPMGGPGNVGNMPLMAVEEAEVALVAAKKETEKLEKSLNAAIKRNRRLLLGGGN